MDFIESLRRSATSFFEHFHFNKGPKVSSVRVWIVSGTDAGFLKKRVAKTVPAWQLRELTESQSPILALASSDGPIWVLRLESPDFGNARDLAGQWLRQNKDAAVGDVAVEFFKVKDREIAGALVGFGLAFYNYKDLMGPSANSMKRARTHFYFRRDKGEISKAIINKSKSLVAALNVARHLTNAPGGTLNPVIMAKAAQSILGKKRGVKVSVWDENRLKKEKMGLLLGVGQGSLHGARLIHISYRPARARGKKPIALVGKGVTFDTGGLDIKNSAGMRLMKKDMAGSAIVFGLALYVSDTTLSTPCDFYLAMAENAVSDRAIRPGDVLISRSGKSVEIHNTDAEGRLVMADALDVAVTRKGADAPSEVIDVATLTGAMRVALGLEVAGYFTNDDKIADQIEKAAQAAGEFTWRMPLVQKYRKQLKSSFADLSNCSESGFGGAISAALFLESFVQKLPWIHFDVMAWNLSADGAVTDGANAHTLQTIAKYLEMQSS